MSCLRYVLSLASMNWMTVPHIARTNSYLFAPVTLIRFAKTNVTIVGVIWQGKRAMMMP